VTLRRIEEPAENVTMDVFAPCNPENVEGVELPSRRAKNAELRGDVVDPACEILNLGTGPLRESR
jgi:hypothetical protein